jgi:predicted metallo-beta-lactamase superfamily hydrolase
VNWRDYIKNLGNLRSDIKIQTAAGYRNEDESLLEAKRKDFYDGKLSVVDNYG